MYCRNCGKEVEDDAIICSHCGRNVDGSKSENKKSKKGIIIAAICLIAVIIGVLIAVKSSSGSDNKKDSNAIKEANSEESTKSVAKQTSKPTSKPKTENTPTVTPENTPTVTPENTPTPTEAIQEKAVRTVMVYMIGSNLETDSGLASADIAEMLAADIPENVNVVLECGGSKEWKNELIPDGEVTRFIIKNKKLVKVEELGEIAMTGAGSLSDFIAFAKNNYPADNYTIDFWDHGGGIPVGFGVDELAEDPYNLLRSYDIKNEMDIAGVDFDVAVFDCCNVGTLEMGMAVKGHADYMIGAESFVQGIGLYYTNWLSETDGDCQSFCETAASDYIDAIHKRELEGSMSLIRLDKIEKVYEAYADFLESVYGELGAGGYDKYVKIRSGFNDFDSVDSIDLVTMASEYDNEKSTKLQNAVTNCVVWTESDFHSGHGITVYSPLICYERYTVGRRAFEQLNYDKRIIDFYDDLMSRYLANLGSEAISEYAGSWYNSKYEIAGREPIVEKFELEEIDGVWVTPNLDIDKIAHLDYYISMWTSGAKRMFVRLGSTNQISVKTNADGTAKLYLYRPVKWKYLNDQIVSWFNYSYDKSATGKKEYTGFIPVLINGEANKALYVKYSDEYPEGRILGYVDFDFQKRKLKANVLNIFKDDDDVTVIWLMEEEDNNEIKWAGKATYKASELVLSEKSFSIGDGVEAEGYLDIFFVNGDNYWTAWYDIVNKETE